MNKHLRRVGDVLLLLFAVVVVTGAVMAVKEGGAPAKAGSTLAVQSVPRSPSSLPPAAPTVQPFMRAVVSSVVLVGPDLAKLKPSLGTSRYDVTVVPAGRTEVLVAGALEAVQSRPDVVVLQVLAGSKTTTRTTSGIAAVQARWPGVRVFVIGPFSSQDRKSAAAAKAAAVARQATFLDPVDLNWRTRPVSPVLSAADVTTVAARLAQAVA